jgi:hypothetical protein
LLFIVSNVQRQTRALANCGIGRRVVRAPDRCRVSVDNIDLLVLANKKSPLKRAGFFYLLSLNREYAIKAARALS